jgi:hypothetical protein
MHGSSTLHNRLKLVELKRDPMIETIYLDRDKTWSPRRDEEAGSPPPLLIHFLGSENLGLLRLYH